jgi:glycosyltransferase involved in cell wall biosynthesis
MRSAPVRVYVHLAHGMGARQWAKAYREGTLLGINEEHPYGYSLAGQENCIIEYSEDLKETVLGRIVRLFGRLLFGFDFVHVWRNGKKIRNCDIIWTHTESQTLGILLFFTLFFKAERPKLIGQCVWLFDQWPRLNALRARLYLALLRRADVITVHSLENLKIAKRLLPDGRVELVRFGIRADGIVTRTVKGVHHPLRIVSLGDDRHRDWATLIASFGSQEGYQLRIASRTINRNLTRSAKNVNLERITHNTELLALYDWADLLVLALKPNRHASGITVLQEATVRGLPIICSDTGGLRTYFDDDAITYVPPNDVTALRTAAKLLAQNPQRSDEKVRRAQHCMGAEGFNSRNFVKMHVRLSRELLGDRLGRSIENAQIGGDSV